MPPKRKADGNPSSDDIGATNLHDAARDGDLIQVQRLVTENPARLEEKFMWGRTAFQVAARNGRLAVVKWLHQNGASLAERDDAGVTEHTPLHLAAMGGHLSTVEFLVVECGLSIAEKTCKQAKRRTALLVTAMGGPPSLSSCHASDDMTPEELVAAATSAEAGRVAVIKWLLSNGSDIGERDSEQKTALHLAAMSGFTPAVEFLIREGGASIADGDFRGTTALLLAVANGRVSTIHWLMAQGGAIVANTATKGGEDYTLTVWDVALRVLKSSLVKMENAIDPALEYSMELSVILKLCEFATPPRDIDQLLSFFSSDINIHDKARYSIAARAWRDSRLGAWQAKWRGALMLDTLPPPLMELVAEYRGPPLLGDMMAGGLGSNPMFLPDEGDENEGEEYERSESEDEDMLAMYGIPRGSLLQRVPGVEHFSEDSYFKQL
jgi:ankyrin repeat protein